MVSLVLRERLETMVLRVTLVLLDLLELQVYLDLRYSKHPKLSCPFLTLYQSKYGPFIHLVEF